MATDDAARRDVIAALENARGNEAFEKTLNWSLWRIYMLDGACEKAVGVLAEAAPKWQPYANQLPVLAREALAVGCYAECSRAYSLAAEYMDDKSKIPSLLLEKARCEVGGGLVEQALATYGSLIERYPATESAGSAALARGGIYRDLGRMEEALAEAERAITLSRERDGAHEAVLFKGDCLVKVGRLEEGFETYDLVQTEWKREHAQEAFFNLGEIAFYQARFDDATGYYNVTLREYPDEPRANDAIDRLMLLKASKAGEAYDAGLTDLAHAMLLKRQRSYTEAETAFRMLAAGDAGAIKIESLRNLSEMYLEQGALEDAITTYLIIGDSLDAHLSPAALEIVGDIYADMGRTEDAVKAYEDVILRFPDSVSAGEARRKIEIARRGSGEDS
jgi:TolA-binding protein